MNKPRIFTAKTFLGLATFCIPALCLLFRPFSFTAAQSLLLGALLQCILCWATNLVGRGIVSTYLLLCFLFIGSAKPLQVFSFIFAPTELFSRNFLFLSENFIFIFSSFLLSTAITKSGLADRLARTAFVKFAKTPVSVVRFSFIAGTLLIFLIPQSFPRVMVMASLYLSFFDRIKISPKMKSALLFSIFVATLAGIPLFINGDIIMSYAALGFAGTTLSYLGWLKYMFVPSFLLMVVMYFIFNLLFGIKKEQFELLEKKQDDKGIAESSSKLLPNEKKVIVTSAVLIILWITEGLHGIASAHVAGLIVIALFLLRVLSLPDLKVVNFSLMMYLTAAFSIGRVLSANGMAGVINSYVFRLLPDANSIFYYVVMALVIMVLHFILGSVFTTLSIVIPTLISLPGSDPIMMTLLAVSLVNTQCFMPFHHVTLLIGAGKGYYSQKETFKFGICMFFVMMLYIPFVLNQWWRIVF